MVSGPLVLEERSLEEGGRRESIVRGGGGGSDRETCSQGRRCVRAGRRGLYPKGGGVSWGSGRRWRGGTRVKIGERWEPGRPIPVSTWSGNARSTLVPEVWTHIESSGEFTGVTVR